MHYSINFALSIAQIADAVNFVLRGPIGPNRAIQDVDAVALMSELIRAATQDLDPPTTPRLDSRPGAAVGVRLDGHVH